MDYHETTKRFVFGGYTRCRELKKNNDNVAGALPLIMSYIPDSHGDIGQPEWGHTIALTGYSFYQISFNKNGLHIVGLVNRDFWVSYVFFISSDGALMNL
jgi:hypothetical protein